MQNPTVRYPSVKKTFKILLFCKKPVYLQPEMKDIK
jgi:hypothetical protein